MGQVWKYLKFTFIVFISFVISDCTSLSLEKEDTSNEQDLVPATHILPKHIFNEGKPFYVDKDPISGQLDFSSKKPAGIEPETNEVIDTQMKSVIINSISPNIHDYLNLPVKYSSSKFVYPLVSSSYANLKYQGNNKNFISHHKESASTTTSPKYYTLRKTTSVLKNTPTTVLTTSSTIPPTTTTSHKTTSVPSTIHTTVTQNKSVPTKSSTTTTTTNAQSTSVKLTTEKSTHKTTLIPTTEQTTPKSNQKSDKTSATKKIVTLFKKHPSLHTTIPMKTSVEPQLTTKTTITTTADTTTSIASTTTSATTPTTTTATTTITTTTDTPSTAATTISTTSTTHPPSISSTVPSSPAHTTTTRPTIQSSIEWEDYFIPDYTENQSAIKFPVVSSTDRNYLIPNEPSAFKPISTTAFPTMNPAAVYNEVAHKKESNKMSLMDLFNALAEEDYYPSGYDNEPSENLNDRIVPSQPAPFTLQKITTSNENSLNHTASLQNSTGLSSNFLNVSNYSNDSNTINFPNTANTPNEVEYPQGKITEDQKNYVRYQVQQPTVMQQYRPVPSSNNVIISPDQNSASFVVGSQQSVHPSNYMGSVDKVPLFDNGDYTNEKSRPEVSSSMNLGLSSGYVHPPEYHTYQNENWNSPQGFESLPPSYNSNSNDGLKSNQESYDSVKLKFPNNEGQNININGGIIQHEALTQNQGNVVFPKTENMNVEDINIPKNPERPDKILFTEEKPFPQHISFAETQEDHKKEILTLNKYNLQKKVNIPTLPEDLTPPALPESSDPKHHQYSYRPQLQFPEAPSHHNDEFNRKKFIPPPYRSKPDHSLPNILPQFRPNAKISNGHSVFTKEPGNIRITHHKMRYPHRSLPPPPPPPSQYVNNRAPIGTHLNVKVMGNDDGNRRIFTVPVPSPPLHVQIVDRMYVKPPIISQLPPLGFNDNYHQRKHYHPHLEPYKPQIQPQPQLHPQPQPQLKQQEITEKLFLEEDHIVNDPPKQEEDKEVPKLEPVVTLQMLKTQKKSPTLSNVDDSPSLNPQKSETDPPVYVVYPVKTSPHMDLLAAASNNGPVLSETRGERPSRAPIDYEYQNTPFSPLRDQPQEPVLVKVKDKSQTLVSSNFPYRLEKIDPQNDRYDDSDYEEDIHPRIINSGIKRKQDNYMNTEIPIAVAYTPTEPNSIHSIYNDSNDKYLPNHYMHHSNTELNNYDQNYEKDFMAPFFPSMSLGVVTNSPNSWSVYSSSTEGYDKSHINRADMVDGQEISTKKFDPDHFQPELQGGFKPIYPPDYKIKSSDEETEEISVYQTNPELNSTPSTTTTTTQIPSTGSTITSTSTSTTPKSTEKKKTKFETSIESLLFGDDEDDDFDDTEENSNKSR